jgi:hypothetical protein
VRVETLGQWRRFQRKGKLFHPINIISATSSIGYILYFTAKKIKTRFDPHAPNSKSRSFVLAFGERSVDSDLFRS